MLSTFENHATYFILNKNAVKVSLQCHLKNLGWGVGFLKHEPKIRSSAHVGVMTYGD